MNYSKTIYKIDSKGKSRFLHVYAEEAWLVQESGQVGTTNAVIHRSECKPKNIGKANETTAEEQAIAEAKSKITNKMSTGYFDTLEEATTSEVILPMLAKGWDNENTKIDWSEEVFVQPKLDGMRCLAFIKEGNVTLMSRKGKVIDTCGHIADSLVSMPDMILNGELYTHGKSFQDNMRLIKKYRPGETERVTYHVYDSVDKNRFIRRFYDAVDSLDDEDITESITTVPTSRIMKPEQVPVFHTKFLSQGYEGTMIRWGAEGYKVNGRSSNLLKYKDFQDRACPVVDIIPADAIPSHGVLVCTFGGQEFKAMYKNSHDKREEILTNKEEYIGQFAEIRYFELTDGGIPRFPICVGFRLDK